MTSVQGIWGPLYREYGDLSTGNIGTSVKGISQFLFFGAAGHVIRIFQDMHVTSHEYLSR